MSPLEEKIYEILESRYSTERLSEIAKRINDTLNLEAEQAAIELRDKIIAQLPHIKVIERCSCKKGPIVSLGYCDACKGTGIKKRQATLEDILESLERPLEILK
jgi:hypothetical protein